MSLQEALKVADLEVDDGLARQGPRGQHSAGGAHHPAAAPQAPAAVVPLTFTTRPFPSEYTKLYSTTFARHIIVSAPSGFHLA